MKSVFYILKYSLLNFSILLEYQYPFYINIINDLNYYVNYFTINIEIKNRGLDILQILCSALSFLLL